jgi:plastocyanin
MRTRTRALGLIAGVVALTAPAAAQAATKTVFMGVPPSAAKSFENLGAEVNDFFPHGIAIHAGDSVKFTDVGFHTIDLIKPGGAPGNIFGPAGTKVAGANDAASQPFWFNGQDNIYFGPALQANNFGKKVTYDGTKEVLSGGPFANTVKPMTVKFKKTGSFTYFCNIHPGMKGKVTVKPKTAKVPTKKTDAKTVKTQISTAVKIAKTLPKKTVPANTVSVGSAGQHGVEFYAFLPATITVPVGTTLNFRMSAGSLDEHTATAGPGNPETEPMSYLGVIAASLQGPPPFDPRAIYPSEPSGSAAASLTPTFHGNGFWNSGVIDDSTATPTLPVGNSVKFGAAGTYDFYCLIHPFMHGQVKVQ